jgi:hypothetical protein
MKRIIIVAALVVVGSTLAAVGREPIRPATSPPAAAHPATAVVAWSNEARRAIVPAGPGGVFGPENYGDKFPGEAAVYMGIAHAAIYDAVIAIHGGYRPYAAAITAPPGTSVEAAVATAAHRVLTGILGPKQAAILTARYDAFMATIANGHSIANGVAIGEQVAAAVLALRADDGRDANPTLEDLDPPAAGAGVWEPGAAPAVGLRMPGIRPLALSTASQFRPNGPSPLTSDEYTDDFEQVAALGSDDSTARRPAQTTQALFWTDHDLRQWNDAMLALAAARGLDRRDTARMLALAHVAGADAMIACFDAKYFYWFWRPYQAIPRAGDDGNAATDPDFTWLPLRPTPNFPEYPSAHACHTSAMATALEGFFGKDRVSISIDSRITNTVRTYPRLHEVVKDVDRARVLAGFHFRNSDQEGATLGRKVATYIIGRRFLPR